MEDQNLGYTVEIVENVREPKICYKEIKLFDDGTAEVELFPHIFVDNNPFEDDHEIHIVECERCGYQAEFEIDVEEPSDEDTFEDEANLPVTPFSLIYDMFLSKITDDMYMEFNEWDTFRLLDELFLSAVHKFEFPRFDITDFEMSYVSSETTYCGVESDNEEVRAFIFSGGGFNAELTKEEMNIIATYMIVEWLGQQLASVENTRMKYSGSDFKFTSQANHMSKLLSLKKDYEREGFHLQRLYKRRKKDENGVMRSTFGILAENSALGRETKYYDDSKWYRNRY